ncbi:50S ribosomal protein L13 [Patescibacteria group bacterium]|nr:50S ribosomal protein L13 [Patescibacteria group bacterium]
MTRKIHKIDVSEKVLGRIATQVALLLRGKNKPTFTPHLDEGDGVLIKNVDKMKFTGKKLTDKVYKHHTGYIGHLRETKLSELYEKNPQKVFEKAVYNMLPKNKLRKEMMKRIKFE